MAVRLNSNWFRKRGRRPTYDWDTWFDGQVWKLIKGVDYHMDTEKFRPQCYVEAKKRGVKVRTTVTDKGEALVLQSYRESDT